MHVLVVVAHPDRKSLTHALAGEFIAGLSSAGHSHDRLDLYGEDFDPIVRLDEYAGWKQGLNPPVVRAYQSRLERAQGLALCYPLWWAAPPALLQGWLQRVFTQGFAFEYGQGPHGLLRHRTQLIVNIGTRDEGQRGRYLEPVISVLNYCGIERISELVNWGIYDGIPAERVHERLAAAREAGAAFG